MTDTKALLQCGLRELGGANSEEQRGNLGKTLTKVQSMFVTGHRQQSLKSSNPSYHNASVLWYLEYAVVHSLLGSDDYDLSHPEGQLLGSTPS